MKNRLAGISTIVQHQTVSGEIELLLLRNIASNEEQMANQLAILGRNTMNVRNMFFGNNQDVNRRLRIEVREGEAKIVLENDLCGNLF